MLKVRRRGLVRRCYSINVANNIARYLGQLYMRPKPQRARKSSVSSELVFNTNNDAGDLSLECARLTRPVLGGVVEWRYPQCRAAVLAMMIANSQEYTRSRMFV